MNKTGEFTTKIHSYLDIARSDETPLSAKILLVAAVGYFLWPFDLIPDFIPIIGYLDDLIIVPFLIWLAFRQIEAERLRRIEEERQRSTIGFKTPDHCQHD
ncbi:MAG: hypothetical protein CVV41_17415 [Candidatus Riflebacteria bacterium HGW-Riflebacteria-1]|jgi:uncharacterized membrane protein YkvA (DUF1232 family)|nr:MAG: hypothetical protein CVV41_17415 [Candidatus Riflebacteria bacterium HGW-Riflebacteria-1]